MYVPVDITRINHKPGTFQQLLVTNVYPIQTSDPNAIYNLDNTEFGFHSLDSEYKAEIGIRIGRTPLGSADPSTYAALSKFTEYYLRRVHASSGIMGTNQLDKPPLTVPTDLISSALEGKSEVMRIGSMLNPLVSDKFQPVQLIPGCISDIVNFSRIKTNETSNLFGNMFGKSKNSKTEAEVNRQPRNNLNRNTSTFVEKVTTCDNYIKKMNHANSLLIASHGRIVNVIALGDHAKEIDIDPPCLKLVVSTSIVTCMATFQYVSDERNLDILLGFASGDILWLNPFTMKYTRWNKNGKVKNEIVTSIEWSKCGDFALVGFADGEVLVWDRKLEDPEEDYIPTIKSNRNYLVTYKSARNATSVQNPIAHYKFNKKPITCIRSHPTFQNIVIVTSDDEFLRCFDLMTEEILEIFPSYYGGTLTAEFTKDGKYLLTGGEDDLVSVYELSHTSMFSNNAEQKMLKLVARLTGAKSWIKSVEIVQSNPKILSYTIGVTGDDGYIRFYEFQPRSLRKVKKHVNHDGVGSYLGSPRYQMHRALSSLSIDPSIDSRRKKFNFSSNTLSSLNTGANKLSLSEVISQQGNSLGSPQLKSTFRLGEGVSFSVPPRDDIDTRKKNLMNKSLYFQDLELQTNNILLSESTTPYVHQCPGMEAVVKLLPVSEKNINLGRMSGIYLGQKYIWAFSSGGDLLRWKVIGI